MFTGLARRTYRVEPMRDPVPRGRAGPAEMDGTVASVPDYFEPVIGWRTWLVVATAAGLGLRSVVFGTDWSPGEELSARCELVLERRLSRPWRRTPAHPAPSPGCECGIWAAKEIDYAADFFNLYGDLLSDTTVHRVIGRVALWGSVVDGGLGWRASRAYPTHIYVPSRRENGREVHVRMIARGLADYGVPVEVVAGDIGAEVDRALQGISGQPLEQLTEPSVR
jgi:hypothetical protein